MHWHIIAVSENYYEAQKHYAKSVKEEMIVLHIINARKLVLANITELKLVEVLKLTKFSKIKYFIENLLFTTKPTFKNLSEPPKNGQKIYLHICKEMSKEILQVIMRHEAEKFIN